MAEANAVLAPVDEMQRLLVTIDDAARMLGGIGRTLLYELANGGEITKVRIGTRSFVTVESIRAYVGRLAAETRRPSSSPPSVAGPPLHPRHRGPFSGARGRWAGAMGEMAAGEESFPSPVAIAIS